MSPFSSFLQLPSTYHTCPGHRASFFFVNHPSFFPRAPSLAQLSASFVLAWFLLVLKHHSVASPTQCPCCEIPYGVYIPYGPSQGAPSDPRKLYISFIGQRTRSPPHLFNHLLHQERQPHLSPLQPQWTGGSFPVRISTFAWDCVGPQNHHQNFVIPPPHGCDVLLLPCPVQVPMEGGTDDKAHHTVKFLLEGKLLALKT